MSAEYIAYQVQAIEIRDILNSTDLEYQQEKLGSYFKNYHENLGLTKCPCAGFTIEDAHKYHLNLFRECIATYYSPIINCEFVKPTNFVQPSIEQLIAMFPDENFPLVLQEILINNGVLTKNSELFEIPDFEEFSELGVLDEGLDVHTLYTNVLNLPQWDL